jgi:pimeloyl-ACP methyl ester carboxylesterase
MSPHELMAEYEAAAPSFAEMTAEMLIEWPENTQTDVVALRETPAAARSLARSMNLGVAAGIWGWLDDQLAWARPWGFRVEDVRVPLIVRHGTEDRIVSVKEARWLAGHIRNATLQELPGGGHSSVAIPFEPVIAALPAADA